MIKAMVIKKSEGGFSPKIGMIVYIHDGRKPVMSYNEGKFVVSRQPDSEHVFCIEKDNLAILDDEE